MRFWIRMGREADILAKMEEGSEVFNSKSGKTQTMMLINNVELGGPLGKITKDTVLEEFAKSGWGDYQIVIFLTGKNESTNGLEGVMGVGKGPNALKVFVLNKEK